VPYPRNQPSAEVVSIGYAHARDLTAHGNGRSVADSTNRERLLGGERLPS
jgi:hypothetical protein